MKPTLLIALLACACTDVSTEGLPSIDGYQDWDVGGSWVSPNPGHADSYRIVYVNDVGRSYGHSGRYLPGTVLVKEVYDGVDGPLRYLAIMRKVGDEDVEAPVEGGWVFTQLIDGEERYLDSCWASCHRQGTYDGAWRDYGR